jgi:hypothetical protein
VHKRARYYDTATGEFTSPDPLEYVDGMSQYRAYFVQNGVDPLGIQTRVQDGVWERDPVTGQITYGVRPQVVPKANSSGKCVAEIFTSDSTPYWTKPVSAHGFNFTMGGEIEILKGKTAASIQSIGYSAASWTSPSPWLSDPLQTPFVLAKTRATARCEKQNDKCVAVVDLGSKDNPVKSASGYWHTYEISTATYANSSWMPGDSSAIVTAHFQSGYGGSFKFTATGSGTVGKKGAGSVTIGTTFEVSGSSSGSIDGKGQITINCKCEKQ